MSKTSEHGWIRDDYYNDSITKVIGKAIADGITRRNEFEKRGFGGVVTFDQTKPEEYSPENWNAVILYNLVAYVLDSRNKYINDAKMFSELETSVFRYYERYYTENGLSEHIDELKYVIGEAIDDIKSYDAALQLTENIMILAQRSNEYEKNDLITNFAPGLCNNEKACAKFGATAIKLNDIGREFSMGNHTRTYEYPYLYWEKNSWYLYGVHYCERQETLSTQDMAFIWRITYQKKYIGYDSMNKNLNLTQILKEYEGLLEVAK